MLCNFVRNGSNVVMFTTIATLGCNSFKYFINWLYKKYFRSPSASAARHFLHLRRIPSCASGSLFANAGSYMTCASLILRCICFQSTLSPGIKMPNLFIDASQKLFVHETHPSF